MDNKVIEKIYDKFILQLTKRLNSNDKELFITDAAKSKIIEEGYDEEFGARPLKRFIQKNIESLIAHYILQYPNNNDIVIDYKDGFYIG